MKRALVLSIAALACGFALSARGQETKTKITYADHVQAIFREHCFACHNRGSAKNDLALDSYDRVMAGGASGEAIKPGDVDGSYLWRLVNRLDEPAMPPKQDKLADAKLQVIKQWILGGALRDSGSVARVMTAPKVDLTASAGAAKPSGPAAMPENLPRQPVVAVTRPGAVTALAASPWAPLVAVAGQKQLFFYHADTAELLGVLPFPEGIAHVLKFSRSGALLVAGGGHAGRQGRVAVYDVRTGKRAFEVGDELDAVLAADIDAKHARIALGGPGRIVRVFSAADGSQRYELRKHTDWIYALEFSPDGLLLASADRAGGVRVWEAERGDDHLSIDGHKGPVTDVSWRSDSKVIATASEDGTVKLWEMEDGRSIRSLSAHPGGVTAARFHHDGRLLTAGRDRTVKLWDAEGKQLRSFGPMSDVALKVAITHDGSRVVAGDWAGEILVWNAADGKPLGRLSSGAPAPAPK